FVLEDQFQEDPPEDPPKIPMADNRTMAELLQAPTEGYEDAIQRFDESFYEAWDGFNDLLRACPHHGFSELHQLDTFIKLRCGCAPMPNLKPSIPYPLRRDNERHHDQANEQNEKFYEIFKDMSFEISFTDALILMPKFASTLKALIRNKEKLSEMARTPDERALFGMDECLALADLGVSINLMPLSVWEGLSLSKLTSTCMTLELADRSVSKPIGIVKDVSFKGKLTLRIENEAITYNLDQTVRYSAKYNQMTANKIDVICEEYSQEVFGFFDVTASGNPTPYDDPIVSTTSPTLTLFGDSNFLLFEVADAFLGLEDDPNSSKINPFYYDPEGDILLLEAILNSKPLPPLPNHEQYMPSFKKELKVCEAKTVKSSVDEPPEVELKDLPPHLEYAFLEGD
nr:hypothetical protein [Tanacetum cinerariifolium]